MYYRILKKDLKRKKTMNLILFLFMVLTSLFVASGVNNILTVLTTTDSYFDKAGISDFFVATVNTYARTSSADSDTEESYLSIEEQILAMDEVESCQSESILYLSTGYFDAYAAPRLNSPILLDFSTAKLHYFQEDNSELTEIKEGEVYLPASMMTDEAFAVGNTLTVTIGQTSMTFRIAGGIKDALLGSDMMGNTRLIIHENDFQILSAEPEAAMLGGEIIYINTQDPDALTQKLAGISEIAFMGDRDMLKLTYIMNLVIAGALLILSVGLILIAFAVLRFTITFTLNEDFREIGVMKAIGIGNRKIRGLYLIKYLMLSVIGSLLGLLLSIPFEKLLLGAVSRSMVMESSASPLINLSCAAAVTAIVMIFCYGCTGKLRRFTPIDAIRSGNSGERFRGKGILHLKNSRLRPSVFMAFQDTFSHFRRFAIMLLTFVLTLTFLIVILNTIHTLKSGNLVPLLGVQQSDLYLSSINNDDRKYWVSGGQQMLEEDLSNIETILLENGIPAACSMEFAFHFSIFDSTKEHVVSIITFQAAGTTNDDYLMETGTSPLRSGKIALSTRVAKQLHSYVGDTVTVALPDGEQTFLVTGIFQTMSNMGESARLHTSEIIDYSQVVGSMNIQITYTDNPDHKEIQRRRELIETLLPDYTLYNADEYADYAIGVAGMVEELRPLILIVLLVTSVLVTVLMERSFIAKEAGEIALLKAIGFQDKSIVRQHTVRIGIVLVISVFISILISTPASQLTSGQIFKIMGADYGIRFDINPLEAYVIYPAIMLIVTLAAAYLTAQYTRKIKARECTGIE